MSFIITTIRLNDGVVSALATLGMDYTMDTRLRYTGKIENDTLKGSLYLIGGFDPEFMDEDLDSLVDVIALSGIRYITDTLAADVSMMDSDRKSTRLNSSHPSSSRMPSSA